jgi:hypothetical protein
LQCLEDIIGLEIRVGGELRQFTTVGLAPLSPGLIKKTTWRHNPDAAERV